MTEKVKIFDTYQTVNYNNGRKLTNYEIERTQGNIIITTDKKSKLSFFSKEGLINLSNKNIEECKEIEPKYEKISEFNDGFAIAKQSVPAYSVWTNNVRDYKYYIIDTDGQELITSDYIEYIEGIGYIYKSNGKYGLLGMQLECLIEPQLEYLYFLNDNYFIFEENDNKKGVIDTSGNKLIPAKYDDIRYINDNRFVVYDETNRWQVIDKNDKVIKKLPKNYYYCSSHKGYIIFYTGKEEQRGVLSADGDVIVKAKFKKITIFDSGMAIGEKSQGFYSSADKYKIINLNDKQFFTSHYDKVNDFDCDVTSCHHKRAGWILLDRQANIVWRHHDLPYRVISKCYEDVFIVGFALSEDHFLYGLIDKDGNEIVDTKYDNISEFKDGIAIIEINNKYGLINSKGIELLKPTYDKIYNFNGGVAEVKLNGKYGLINKDGKEILKPTLSKIDTVETEGNLVLIQYDDSKLCLLDKEGHKYFDNVRFHSACVVNDHQIIIDEYLFNIDDLKWNQNVEIECEDIKALKSFETTKELKEYLKELVSLLDDKLQDEETWYKQQMAKLDREKQERLGQVLNDYGFQKGYRKWL